MQEKVVITENSNVKNNEIKKIARQILKEIGVNIHLLGYGYWVAALQIASKSDERKLAMMELYYVIAERYKTSASKVEKAMRYAYEGKKTDLKKYFNVTQKIDNSTLLILLLEKLEEYI